MFKSIILDFFQIHGDSSKTLVSAVCTRTDGDLYNKESKNENLIYISLELCYALLDLRMSFKIFLV